MEIKQTSVGKIKSIFLRLITEKKRALVVSIAVFAICVLATSSALAYSIKLKSDGNKEYENKNYMVALPKYKSAQQWWFPEKVSFKLRDRDLHSKLTKAEIMVKSGNNYIKGIDAFNNKKYLEAENYLTKLVISDPHYQEAQKLVATIQSESLPKPASALARTTPISTTSKQETIGNADNNTANNNPTGIDWNEFEKNLNEKLKGIGTNNNQTNQPTPTPSYNDLHCPKVIKIEDNLGNTSTTNMLKGTFAKGSIALLTVKITSTDPQNLQLYYQYGSAGLIDGNSTIKDWSKDSVYAIDVSNAMPGASRVLSYSIDNQDGYSCAGDYTDIHGQFNYDVTP